MSELADFLKEQAYPPRRMPDLLADLNAQRAAGNRGMQLLSEYCESLGWQLAASLAEATLAASETKMQQYISTRFPVGKQFTAEDFLEDGTPIQVNIVSTNSGSLTCDFAGSGSCSKQNLNANPSIVSACLLYVLRCLVNDDLPLNEGTLRCIKLQIPEGVLNPTRSDSAHSCVAVAAGNVETSQRIVDVLLTALEETACSQGTMNNVLFGDDAFGFYETLCGGAGATQRHPGASCVHSHMTNTRLTDPEVLEARYPIRLESFRQRRNSGGLGLHSGGNGVIRQIRFLRDVEISLLTSRRSSGPPGLAGGQAGSRGRNLLISSAGERHELPAFFSGKALADWQLRIETPGGGGWGKPQVN